MKTLLTILWASPLALMSATAQAEYHLTVGTGLAANLTYDDQTLRVRSRGTTGQLPMTVVGSNSAAFKLALEDEYHSMGLIYVAPHRFQFREIDASWEASQLTFYNNFNMRLGRFMSSIGLNFSQLDARSLTPAYSIQRAATDLGWDVVFGWRLTERLAIDYTLNSNSVNFDLRRNADGRLYHWVQGELITSVVMLSYAVN